jgi:hypothetical protein
MLFLKDVLKFLKDFFFKQRKNSGLRGRVWLKKIGPFTYDATYSSSQSFAWYGTNKILSTYWVFINIYKCLFLGYLQVFGDH